MAFLLYVGFSGLGVCCGLWIALLTSSNDVMCFAASITNYETDESKIPRKIPYKIVFS